LLVLGSVYKGTYNGKTVAIKISKPGAKQAMEEFLKEAEVMMTIPKHPNIVSLVGTRNDFNFDFADLVPDFACARV